MYRQVEISSKESTYQKILWRKSLVEPLKICQLKTVIYVIAFAPFFATRVLSQLAKDVGHSYLVAASVLIRDFYVTDLLIGAASLKDTSELRNELIDHVKNYGLELR